MLEDEKTRLPPRKVGEGDAIVFPPFWVHDTINLDNDHSKHPDKRKEHLQSRKDYFQSVFCCSSVFFKKAQLCVPNPDALHSVL